MLCYTGSSTHDLEEVERGDCAEPKLQLLHDEKLHPLNVRLTAGTAILPHQGLQQRGYRLGRGEGEGEGEGEREGEHGMGSLSSDM